MRNLKMKFKRIQQDPEKSYTINASYVKEDGGFLSYLIHSFYPS